MLNPHAFVVTVSIDLRTLLVYQVYMVIRNYKYTHLLLSIKSHVERVVYISLIT